MKPREQAHDSSCLRLGIASLCRSQIKPSSRTARHARHSFRSSLSGGLSPCDRSREMSETKFITLLERSITVEAVSPLDIFKYWVMAAGVTSIFSAASTFFSPYDRSDLIGRTPMERLKGRGHRTTRVSLPSSIGMTSEARSSVERPSKSSNTRVGQRSETFRNPGGGFPTGY